MNVFVLNTGRCGSTTFAKACSHISNYSSGHEINTGRIGRARMEYPDNHIEADNRLSWMLGRLDSRFGKDAFYVHLTRDKDSTAKSHAKRFSKGIIPAYKNGILRISREIPPLKVAEDYHRTVSANIEMFLKDKPDKMRFRIENAKNDFVAFWEAIDAEGDLDAALSEFDVKHNASGKARTENLPRPLRKLARRIRTLSTRR